MGLSVHTPNIHDSFVSTSKPKAEHPGIPLIDVCEFIIMTYYAKKLKSLFQIVDLNCHLIKLKQPLSFIKKTKLTN